MRALIEMATQRRVTIVMFTVAIGLFGMVSLNRLNLNLLPDISYPTLTVRTELTGAAPVEIESLIRWLISVSRFVEHVHSGFPW